MENSYVLMQTGMMPPQVTQNEVSDWRLYDTLRITTSVATRVEKEITGQTAVGELSDYDKPIITTSVGTRMGEDSIDPIPSSVARGSLDVHKAPQHNTQRKYEDVKKNRRLSSKIKRLETKIEKNCKTFALENLATLREENVISANTKKKLEERNRLIEAECASKALHEKYLLEVLGKIQKQYIYTSASETSEKKNCEARAY